MINEFYLNGLPVNISKHTSFHRFIWNTSKNFTLYLVPKGKSDTDEDVKKVEIGNLNRIGDSNPEKVEEIGDYTLKVEDPVDDALLISKDITLKLGASYEFLVQWNDQEGENNLSSSQLITVSVSKLDVNILLLLYLISLQKKNIQCHMLFKFSEYNCI